MLVNITDTNVKEYCNLSLAMFSLLRISVQILEKIWLIVFSHLGYFPSLHFPGNLWFGLMDAQFMKCFLIEVF